MTIYDLQWIVNTLPIDVRNSKVMVDGREITAIEHFEYLDPTDNMIWKPFGVEE